jgi:hypothetical protein
MIVSLSGAGGSSFRYPASLGHQKGTILMKPILSLTLILTLFCFVGLLGCNDSSEGPEQATTGEIRMHLVDSPADYDAVNVVVTEVSVHASGASDTSGWAVIDSTNRTFDLLSLTNGASAILGDAALGPGHYTQIRLKIGEGSTVVVKGVSYPLSVSSGDQSGLKLNHQFDIEAGALYELTLDFDAARSITNIGGANRYSLRPVIRVVATQTSGTISGIIDPAAARAEISTTVAGDTVSTVADTTGAFKLMALPADTYSLDVAAQGYRDTTLSPVAVVAGRNTDVGTIALRSE